MNIIDTNLALSLLWNLLNLENILNASCFNIAWERPCICLTGIPWIAFLTKWPELTSMVMCLEDAILV